MTRIFTDAGEHIPVTVLRLEHCQVVGHRTSEKNGYTALQLGAGRPKVKRLSRAARGHFAVANVEPKRKLAEFRVEPRQSDRGGRGDHGRPFRRGPVCGCVRHLDRQGFCRRDEAPRLRRPAREPWRVGEPSQPRFDRAAPGPRQGVQGQEDGRPYGRRQRHHPEFARGEDRSRARADHDPRRGAGSQGRLGAVARRRQALPAGGGAEARRVPQGRAAEEAKKAKSDKAEAAEPAATSAGEGGGQE